MAILFFIFIGILVIIAAFLLFKILKWVFKRKERVLVFGVLSLCIVAGITINKLFFIKMEFLKSNVYPDLYLIKNPVKNKDSVYKAIKEKVFQEMNSEFMANSEPSKEHKNNRLGFYEYYTGDWGEQGTAYFIENEERPDGMTAEILDYYPDYLLAEFSIHPCKRDRLNTIAILKYYHERQVVQIDTLFNACKNMSTPINEDTDFTEDLALLTKQKATEIYGTTTSTEQFILDDAQGEFRNIISDIYTKKERQSASIVIDEVTWEKDKTTWITVWYEAKDKASIPKAVLIWVKGTKFKTIKSTSFFHRK